MANDFVTAGIKEVFLTDYGKGFSDLSSDEIFGLGIRQNSSFNINHINEIKDHTGKIFPNMVNFKIDANTMQIKDLNLLSKLLQWSKDGKCDSAILTSKIKTEFRQLYCNGTAGNSEAQNTLESAYPEIYHYIVSPEHLTMDETNKVSVWKEANAPETNPTLYQNTGSAQPLYVENGYNGFPVIRMDGLLENLRFTKPARTASEFSLLFVARFNNYDSLPASTQQDLVNGSSQWYAMIKSKNSNSFHIGGYVTAFTNKADGESLHLYGVSAQSIIPTVSPRLYKPFFKSLNQSYTGGTHTVVSPDSAVSLYFGGASLNSRSAIDILEIVYFEKENNSLVFNGYVDYLKNKYGITS